MLKESWKERREQQELDAEYKNVYGNRKLLSVVTTRGYVYRLPSNLNLYDDKVVDGFYADDGTLVIRYVDENKDDDEIEAFSDDYMGDENDIISSTECDYEEMNDTAATTIQAAARGMLGRLFVKMKLTAIRIVQAAARGFLGRLIVKKKPSAVRIILPQPHDDVV